VKYVRVVGYMAYTQFEDAEKDDNRESGLVEQIEKDLIEQLSEDMDDVKLTLIDVLTEEGL
jgi:hypothetical protein